MVPFGDVITRLPEPVEATATNNDNCGDQHTEFQLLSAAEVLVDQLIPFEEVITRFPVPELETATNNPSSAAQQTLVQLPLDAET